MRVFVLNSAFECVSQTTPHRALAMVESGKAELVKWSEKAIATIRGAIKVPAVIRLFRYIQTFGRHTKYSNRTVWERDNFTCQYCGKEKLSRSDIETDHVVPRCRGGKTIFDNMVTCCHSCNQKKADRTPEECGMKLSRKPVKPGLGKAMLRLLEEAREILNQEGQYYTG